MSQGMRLCMLRVEPGNKAVHAESGAWEWGCAC